MSMSNPLMETAKRHFGDHASMLLDGHAVVPLNNPRNTKAAVKGWQNGWDPNIPVQFHSLAILTGAPSGITVWDIDDREAWSPPVPANVITSKGQHIYTPYDGEEGKIGLAPKLDLLSDGRYAIFHGHGKTFRSPAFASTDVMTEWLSTVSPSSCIASTKSSETEFRYRVKTQSYNNWLRDEHGIELDVEAIRQAVREPCASHA